MGDYMFHSSIIRLVPFEQINFFFSSEPQLKNAVQISTERCLLNGEPSQPHLRHPALFLWVSLWDNTSAYQQLLSETQNFAHEAGLF